MNPNISAFVHISGSNRAKTFSQTHYKSVIIHKAKQMVCFSPEKKEDVTLDLKLSQKINGQCNKRKVSFGLS